VEKLKYRIWDTVLKFYVDIDFYIIRNGKIFFDNGGDLIEQTDKLNVELFTWCKDKNGIDVFENDTVITISGSEREVGFNSHRSQFGLYSRQLECWITNELLSHGVEIIGNIHKETK
jgi:hypothetical protein